MTTLVAIENTVTGKKCFGTTKLDPEKYMANKFRTVEKDNPLLATELRVYGPDNFVCYPVVTKIVDKKTANNLKNLYISQYGSHTLDGGYNNQYSAKNAQMGQTAYEENILNHSSLNANNKAESDAFKLSLCHEVDNSRPYYVYRQQTSAA